MSELELMHILWSASTIMCSICILNMISTYKKLSSSLSIISLCLHHIVMKKDIVEVNNVTSTEPTNHNNERTQST